jgi:hypothetical protein
MKIMRRLRATAGLLLLCALAGCEQGVAQDAKNDSKGSAARPVFAEADAVLVLGQMRQAFESDSRSRFLKLFDARRMPGYAVFRDEVYAFFEMYDLIQLNYHVTQVAMDGEFGGAMVDLTLEATPKEAGTPGVRRHVQARLVLAWDGKGWKIADMAPRDLFRS